MTPEVCLISVPHTGTMFVREIFVSNGWHEQGLNGRPNPTPTLYQGHCAKTGQTMSALMLGKRMPIVMPLRHPYRVEESWRRRNYDDEQRCSMWVAYHHMLTYLEPVVDCWVPLDAPPLIKVIAHNKLDAMAGKPLKIDWGRLVNAEKGTHDIDVGTLHPSENIKLVRQHRLFTEFYGDSDEKGDAR